MRTDKQISPLTRGLTLIGLAIAGWGIIYVGIMTIRSIVEVADIVGGAR